jgi:hypothetical protein
MNALFLAFCAISLTRRRIIVHEKDTNVIIVGLASKSIKAHGKFRFFNHQFS